MKLRVLLEDPFTCLEEKCIKYIKIKCIRKEAQKIVVI